MNVHEYQAKQLFEQFEIPTPRGEAVKNVDRAVEAAEKLGGDTWVVKAQVHAGGRGKAGGVCLAKSLEEVRRHSGNLLGSSLVTHQTGPGGETVHALLIEEGCQIEHEYYIAVVLDRQAGVVTFIASSEGGMDIEKVAAETPEKIVKVAVPSATGFTPFMGRKLAYGVGLKESAQVAEFGRLLTALYHLYTEKDCTIAEINPLIRTGEGKFLALDAKLNFDSNGLFRHPDVGELYDPTQESDKEREASEAGLSYIKLEGDIGCLVNGAGLAMGTMDIIQLYGGAPANFLDVGGGADKETVAKAFSLILQESGVKAILVNIFGGIMRCDVIAEGVIEAAKSLGVKVPLVVRLEGTNVALGKKILSDSGLSIIAADDLASAAQKAVAAAKGEQL